MGLLILAACWAAPARAETPGVKGLALSPENQDALKERNLAPGRRNGLATGARPGGIKSPGKMHAPSNLETPQGFREKHRLHKGAAPNQNSKDVLLNQRIQGQGPNSLQRLHAPTRPAVRPPMQAPTQPTAPEAPQVRPPEPPQAPSTEQP